MSTPFSPAVQQLIQQQMSTGRYASENDLLAEALYVLAESDEELRAIEAGLDSVDRGEVGVSLDEAFERLRNKHPAS